MPDHSRPLGETVTTPSGPTARRVTRPGRVRRRVRGFRLGQGLCCSRPPVVGSGTLFLNPHIAWCRKSNLVSTNVRLIDNLR
jgi:hypothetical protein